MTTIGLPKTQFMKNSKDKSKSTTTTLHLPFWKQILNSTNCKSIKHDFFISIFHSKSSSSYTMHFLTSIFGRSKELILHCTYHDIFHYTTILLRHDYSLFPSKRLDHPYVAAIFHYLIFHDFMHAYFSESLTFPYPFQFIFAF